MTAAPSALGRCFRPYKSSRLLREAPLKVLLTHNGVPRRFFGNLPG